VHVTETDGVPWCPCRRHPIFNHEEGPKQGKTSVNNAFDYGIGYGMP